MLLQERSAGFIEAPIEPEAMAAQRMIKVGVIGYGYWGPKLVRNLQELPFANVVMVSDLDKGRLAQLHKQYPEIIITHNYVDLLESDIDAVVIATQVGTHARISLDCLGHGKHVLVEKPLARNRVEGQAMVDLAAARGLVLMVGHTFEYNPAVEALKNIIASGEIGRVYYVHASRTNLGIFQKDVNVLWDLAPHDISILQYVLGRAPLTVSACGEAYVRPGIHDVVRLTVNFDEQVQAHVLVSWLDPCKVRRITIVGDKKMVVYDDVEMLEKIKIYDKGVESPDHTDNYGEFQLSYRYGDVVIPRIPLHEPLKMECAHFVDCILNNRQPRSNGQVGLNVVKVLESAEKSLLNGGMREPIIW